MADASWSAVMSDKLHLEHGNKDFLDVGNELIFSAYPTVREASGLFPLYIWYQSYSTKLALNLYVSSPEAAIKKIILFT